MSHGEAGPDANPELSALFAVELDGIEVTAFNKCAIDGIEWSTMSNRTGIDGLEQTESSGTRKARTISLEKNLVEGGWADMAKIYEWADAGSADLRSGAVVELNRSGEEIGRFTFGRAWIKKFIPPENDAQSEDGPKVYKLEISAPDFKIEG
jgi:phage tail-like protein